MPLLLLVPLQNSKPKPNLKVVVGYSRPNFLMVVDRVLEPVVLEVEAELTLMLNSPLPPLEVPWPLVASKSAWDPP